MQSKGSFKSDYSTSDQTSDTGSASDLREPLLANCKLDYENQETGIIGVQNLQEQQMKEEEENKKRSVYGYVLMLMFVISNSLADSVSKLLYVNHADLGVMEMLFMRGVFVILLMAYLVGSRWKEILYDTIPRDMIFPLFVRVNSGLLAFFCTNQAIKYLPIVLVSLFANTLPLFCSLLGFLILGERISKIEVFCLVLAFFGIYVLLYSGHRTSDEGKQSQISAWPLFMLVMGPTLMAVTNICLRYMRKLHEYTASTYSVLYSLSVYGAILAISEKDSITMINTFSYLEWFVLVFVSLLGGAGMLFKTKALQFEMAGRLGILMYFSVIFTFFFDLIFIGTAFSTGEIQGISIVLAANLISAYSVFKKNFMQPKPEQIQQKQANQGQLKK